MTHTENPQARQRLLSATPDAESVSFGNWLRRQRELREISLREIADVTKISIRYLEALEQDRFDVLPAPVFAKGFLREYARYVGLDPDEVVNSYLTAQTTVEPEEAPEMRGSQRRPGRLEKTSGLLLTLAVVVLLAVVGGLAYFIERSQDDIEPELPPMAAPPPVSVVEPTAQEAVVSVPSMPLVVTLDFTGECWVEAVIDDERQISELHIAGEALRLEAAERIVLTLGDPGVVIVEANGQPFTVEAPAGSVARDIVIDLAALTAQDPQTP
jgi:cytoskeleton protein RodZ